ncbi:MAG: hypothetical protein K0S32_1684 [Bacteroidetes bacterium]|jgi:hypothetical protein|nr:hypothetical protein [Bacteroidota bacterium]
MTPRKIQLTLKKIDHCKSKGFYLEALLRNYHLNAGTLRFISTKLTAAKHDDELKVKHILSHLVEETGRRGDLKSIIGKKNLKTVKPWLSKMDVFFKTLKSKEPANVKTLLSEGEKIFAILQISATKIFVGHRS